MLIYLLIGLSSVALITMAWRKLYPKPYPGIPYNEESANRVTGDIPDLVPIIEASGEFSNSVFSITTQKLRTPIAQLLFPAVRKPLIILDDPREIEDIIVRRNKEFDKAPIAIDIFSPMFPQASISQYTTPKLKAQKRLWADVMNTEFLRRAAAPNIHKATLELIHLWKLKASTVYKDQPISVLDDFQNATLDAIWVAVVGEEPGMTRFEIKKLQRQILGDGDEQDGPPPPGVFLREEVAYIGQTIARNSNTPVPKWAQKLETYTPRYRRFRSNVTSEISSAMKKAVGRFERLEMGKLEADEYDTCMMDLVLRRQVLEAKKERRALTDPTKDQNMLDEMFVMLVGVCCSLWRTRAVYLTISSRATIPLLMRSLGSSDIWKHTQPFRRSYVQLLKLLSTALSYLQLKKSFQRKSPTSTRHAKKASVWPVLPREISVKLS